MPVACFGEQQRRAVATLDLSQQDFFAELTPGLRHWQLPLFSQLPQQAFAETPSKQPSAAQLAVQSTGCPNTVLNMVSTSKAAIGDRGTAGNIVHVQKDLFTACIFRNDPVESKRTWGILETPAAGGTKVLRKKSDFVRQKFEK